MIIKEVETIEEATRCDTLLTKLILDEKKYNPNIKDDVVINNYYPNIKDDVVINNYYPNIYNKDDNKLYVSIIDNNIVGYIFVKLQSIDGIDNNKELLIDALYVEEEYRNKGIATSLINKVKEYSKNNNIKYISINVLYKNEDAMNLYNKLGFSIYSLGLKFEL
jgi:GNAT superfamily N-acetyltransferase